MSSWSNLAKIIYRRTYARTDNGVTERWEDTVERVIRGNVRAVDPKFVRADELDMLRYFLLNRKAGPAGRGLWYSGTESHAKLGGAALNNCWFFAINDWQNLVDVQDMLMLGGGVGASVEHRFVSKLPKIRKDVDIRHQATADADHIVPDSREGWCDLTRRVLESFFVTGRSLSYSTVCVRGAGESIKGFGGKASGPRPLVEFVSKIARIMQLRAGKHLRPIDVADIICAIGEMVVAGNVRRSAILLLGDPWDKEYLKAKRWDLGALPTQRSNANWSVVVDDADDLHPLFWDTYQHGEAFGIFNRKNVQRYGRMGEEKPDTAVGTNPCAEATLESHEACNLQDIALPNLDSESEFYTVGVLMHRYGKRVSLERYHNAKSDKVIKRNRRIGTGITGCVGSSLFQPRVLDDVYAAIDRENHQYSAELGIPPSIRTTVVKPSGTWSKLVDCPWGSGIHGAFSRYIIQRVRFAADDGLIPLLRAAGHKVEPAIRLDGSLDHGTLVVEFYEAAPEGVPCADDGYTTWQQLDTLLLAQRHWADQAVSVTVYYRREDIPRLQVWLKDNLQYIKTISFLCHNDHGFLQAPWEAITKETYEREAGRLLPIDASAAGQGVMETLECEGGACPIK